LAIICSDTEMTLSRESNTSMTSTATAACWEGVGDAGIGVRAGDWAGAGVFAGKHGQRTISH
jgi:hypothetical protein